MTDSITKKCKQCGETKSINEFYYNNFWKIYRSKCKQCTLVKERERQKKYYSDNSEKIKEKHREHNEAHRDEHNERTKLWKENNPDAVHAQRHKRRALRKGREGSYTAQDWRELCDRYDNKCLCCGEKTKLTADHVIPLSEGGTNYIENIQPLCLSCNSKKYTKTIDYRTIPESP